VENRVENRVTDPILDPILAQQKPTIETTYVYLKCVFRAQDSCEKKRFNFLFLPGNQHLRPVPSPPSPSPRSTSNLRGRSRGETSREIQTPEQCQKAER
jgi:hypothetical protein